MLRRRVLLEAAVLLTLTACACAAIPHLTSVDGVSGGSIVVTSAVAWCAAAIGVRTASPKTSCTLSAAAGVLWGVWMTCSVWGTSAESMAMCGLIPLGLIGGTFLGGVTALLTSLSLDALRRRALVPWSLLRAAWLVAIAFGASSAVAGLPNLPRAWCQVRDDLCHALLAASVARYAALALAVCVLAERTLLLLAIRRLRAGGCLPFRVDQTAGGRADDDAAVPTLDALPGFATVQVSRARQLDAPPFRSEDAGRLVSRIGRRASAGVAVLLVEIAGLIAMAVAILR